MGRERTKMEIRGNERRERMRKGKGKIETWKEGRTSV
jgi:hypothetical protein